MTKTAHRFGILVLIVNLLIAGAQSAPAQGLLGARRSGATETVFDFRDICFRSLLGINDEVLADSGRFPIARDWFPPIELGERFGDFTNATMTVTKDRNTGKLALSDVKFIKVLGPEADDKALLKEYEHAVDLVSKLLGVSVACPGLVDSEVYLGRRYFNSIDRRIKSRTLLNLAKGQRVEVEATEASYAIRAGQPIQITAPIVEIEFTYGGSLRTQRSSGQDFESVRELTLGMDCSDLLSMKMRVQQEQSKLRDLQRQNLQTIQENLKRDRETKATETKNECATSCFITKPVSEKISVAEKLGQCDFLLNNDFKKGAKVYLCLFSASWCPPCRAEMPRIAKTYAETLKDDPDIELIHFSRDQNDEKALAWAKEHDVQFPVVKPKGGNPLDLHSRGIPHLFIVKADGTLLEEGHPMRIFNEEKFREIKSGNMKPRTADADLKSGERTEQVDGYTWTYRVENGGATIVAAGGKRRCTISPSPKGNLTIPSKLGGINVTKIGSEAFCECSGITSVTFPASLKEICWRAFSECGSLSSVTIPAGVAKIYPSAFSGCKSLKTITVSDENAQYASRDGILFDKGVKTLVCYPGGISGEYAVPSGVTRIGGNAFSGCSGLTSVTVSDDVTQIGEWAFSSCRGLNSVKIGRGVTRIAQGPFYRCSGLTSVSVDAGNERYSSRDGVLFDKGMKTLICCPSGISGEYVIPSSVTSIEIYAFDSCRKLTSVTIPDGVTSIAQSVFCYSDQLTVVSVPGSVERIGDWAFSGCRGLDTVKISNGVTSIGTGMFCGCFKLTSMTIPSSVKSIKKYAFSGCRELTSVTMQGERPEVEADAFKSCDKLKAIHVPANAKSWAGMKEWQGIPLVFDAVATTAKCGDSTTACVVSNKSALEKISVAEKLAQCDFLLNKDFKKNAKFYLCLFSASWCGPCRAEMPRIAKTYAETLKDDPDIELIHFSRDQNDEKAMAWAKEHDVKFPVVKPKGGNPLDLHSRGIPHLFIVRADGTLVEEGHPMRIFNEEKFRELKGGGTIDGEKPQDDKTCSSATEGVTNVTEEGGLFTLTGPYGIRMTADPGCEKGAEYVMKKLVEVYLPRAKEFYGDPFLGEKPSRTYRIDVDRNDGLGNSQYTGPSYRPGTGSWNIGLSKGADRYEMSLDYLASSVLTLCEEPKWASFVFYVNRFVEARAKGIDAALRLKEDIRRGLEDDDEDGKNKWYRSHAPLWAALEDMRTKHLKLIPDYCALKNKRFAEGKLPKKLSLDQMAALLSEVSGENASELFNKYGVKDSNAKKAGNGGNSPARAKTRGGKDYSKGEKGTAAVDGITWSYSIQDGEAMIVSPTGKLYGRAVAPQPVGDISIPSAVNGTPVTGIGKFALCNCPELVSVKIPNTVKHIDEWAFSGCANLIEVTIPSSVTEIGECVFASCPQLARIGVGADNPNYKVIGGVLYTKDMKCLVTGHGGLTSVTILAGVTDIGVGAFRCCRKLKSVTIPSSVKRIGKDAFCATALESIVIPSGVESIGNATFWCCGGMKSVVLSEGVKSIGFRAFLQCRGLESLTIPASVKRIEEFAFEGCSGLKSVTMCGERPEAKEKVFDKCDNLAAIHVPPNAKSWAGMKEWQGIPLVFDAETK